MTKIVSLINQKGGVGKTTSSVNIAAALALDGYKTLLVDLDQQGNATQGLGISKPEFTIGGAMLGQQEIMTYPVKENLDIIPCDISFSVIDRELEAEKYANLRKEVGMHNILKVIIGEIKGYDVIVMDCPPALGFVTISALIASNFVFIPMIAQLYSLQGVKEVLKSVDDVRTKYNPDLNLGGLFFTLFDKRTILARDLRDEVKELASGALLNTLVRNNVALEESPSMGVDIFEYKEDSNGAEDYRSLTEEIKLILFPDNIKAAKKSSKQPEDKTASIRKMFENYLEEREDNE